MWDEFRQKARGFVQRHTYYYVGSDVLRWALYAIFVFFIIAAIVTGKIGLDYDLDNLHSLDHAYKKDSGFYNLTRVKGIVVGAIPSHSTAPTAAVVPSPTSSPGHTSSPSPIASCSAAPGGKCGSNAFAKDALTETYDGSGSLNTVVICHENASTTTVNLPGLKVIFGGDLYANGTYISGLPANYAVGSMFDANYRTFEINNAGVCTIPNVNTNDIVSTKTIGTFAYDFTDVQSTYSGNWEDHGTFYVGAGFQWDVNENDVWTVEGTCNGGNMRYSPDVGYDANDGEGDTVFMAANVIYSLQMVCKAIGDTNPQPTCFSAPRSQVVYTVVNPDNEQPIIGTPIPNMSGQRLAYIFEEQIDISTTFMTNSNATMRCAPLLAWEIHDLTWPVDPTQDLSPNAANPQTVATCNSDVFNPGVPLQYDFQCSSASLTIMAGCSTTISSPLCSKPCSTANYPTAGESRCFRPVNNIRTMTDGCNFKATLLSAKEKRTDPVVLRFAPARISTPDGLDLLIPDATTASTWCNALDDPQWSNDRPLNNYNGPLPTASSWCVKVAPS